MAQQYPQLGQDDLTPLGTKKIIPTNNRAIAPRTNLGTRAIIPASDAIPKTKASIGVSNTKAALGNSAVIPPEQALKPPGKSIVPIGNSTLPPVREGISVKDGFFKVQQPLSENGFTMPPNYDGSIPPNRSLVPAGVNYPGSGQAIKAASIDSTNIIDNGLKAAGSAIKSNALKIGGTALAVGPEAYNTYKDITTKGMDASDKAARIAEGATRTGAALAGAEAGAGLGFPAGPIGSIAGGLAGGALGYYAPDILNKMQSSITGNNIKFPSDKAAELQAANSAVVSTNTPSNTATNQAQSFTPKPRSSNSNSGQYNSSVVDQMFPDQAEKIVPTKSSQEPIIPDNGEFNIPYKSAAGGMQYNLDGSHQPINNGVVGSKLLPAQASDVRTKDGGSLMTLPSDDNRNSYQLGLTPTGTDSNDQSSFNIKAAMVDKVQ